MILKDVVCLYMSMKRCVASRGGMWYIDADERSESLFFVDCASFGDFETLLHFPEE